MTRTPIALVALVSCLAACRPAPPSPLDGPWTVTHLACVSERGDPPMAVDATYTFEGDGGHTRWTLPGCTVRAQFDVAVDGETVRLRERRHECTVTPTEDGVQAIPCCESAEVDVTLIYTARVEARTSTWTAKLDAQGAQGPWAGRGAWRRCQPGDVGTMRLERR